MATQNNAPDVGTYDVFDAYKDKILNIIDKKETAVVDTYIATEDFAKESEDAWENDKGNYRPSFGWESKGSFGNELGEVVLKSMASHGTPINWVDK